MKTTVCCQGTGITPAALPAVLCLQEELKEQSSLFWFVLRYQTSDTEYETPKGYHHPDAYYDDDEQPLYHDSRRSPKRRLLPATPQGDSKNVDRTLSKALAVLAEVKYEANLAKFPLQNIQFSDSGLKLGEVVYQLAGLFLTTPH